MHTGDSMIIETNTKS